MMPYSIGLFTALLRHDGFEVGLFDSSFYVDDLNCNFKNRQTAVKEYDWAERGLEFAQSNMLIDFVKKIEKRIRNAGVVTVIFCLSIHSKIIQ